MPVRLITKLFLERLEDEDLVKKLIAEYIRICLGARSERLRFEAIADLLTRLGFGRDEKASAQATATVIQIFRNGVGLGIGQGAPPESERGAE